MTFSSSFLKKGHCIHIRWCLFLGLRHNDPWVGSHMWPQQTLGQRSSWGHWPCWLQCATHRLIKTQIGHARLCLISRPTPVPCARDSNERVQIHVRENLCSYATNPPHFSVRELLLCDILITHAGDGRWPRYQAKSLACPGCGATPCGLFNAAHVGPTYKVSFVFDKWYFVQENDANFNLQPNNPDTFTGVVGKGQKKEGGREGGEKSMCSTLTGARARTRDLPRARRGSPAAHHGICLDKRAFPWR